MNLRPYQLEAIDAVNDYLQQVDDHGVISIPTGGGKTVVFATMIRDWIQQWSSTRVCILAHRQELLEQAESKLKAVWSDAPVGVWSAGLKRKEGKQSILIAGIQSVYKRAFQFDPFDIIIVDEAHLVPNSSDTMYRRFLADAKLCNPNVRYVGFTATPFRLDGGPLCGDNKLFTHVIYEANVRSLIDDGYLCNLRTKATAQVLDAKGVKIRNGDYAAADLMRAIDTQAKTAAAVAEIVDKGRDRKKWLVFSAGVEHAEHIAAEMARHNISVAVIVGDTDSTERREALAAFDRGDIQCMVNCMCLTTGLDVTGIDLIAVLRPTQSTSLWIQMCGRGFRLDPNKTDCLILDFGENCKRHGPLDNPTIKQKGGDGTGEAPVKTCPQCSEIVHAASVECPACGFTFPPREIKHETKAATDNILTPTEPWEMDVAEVELKAHTKPGKQPSLQVTYRNKSGMQSHREWVCLQHEGYARQKAAQWWARRFPGETVPQTVAEAMTANLFLADAIARITKRIKVRQEGKYTTIIGHVLEAEPMAISH